MKEFIVDSGRNVTILDSTDKSKRGGKNKMDIFDDVKIDANYIFLHTFLIENEDNSSFEEDIFDVVFNNNFNNNLSETFNEINNEINNETFNEINNEKIKIYHKKYENSAEFINDKSGEITSFYGTIICIYDCNEDEKLDLFDEKKSIFGSNFNRLYVIKNRDGAAAALTDSINSGYKSIFIIEKK